MYASDTSRHPLQSCLVFDSILDLLLKTSFWANVYSSYYIILSYLVKNSIQRNMNRRGEKREGGGREKSLSFTKVTREMNQYCWRASNRYFFFGKSMEKVTCIWKSSFLDLEPSTMIQTSLFLTSTDVLIRKYSSMFGFPWKNPSVNSQWFIKKHECSDMA